MLKSNNKDLEKEFYSIIDAISKLTEEISNITKYRHFNPDIDLVSIDDKYKKRNQKINQLNEILSSSNGTRLVNNNPQWNEFIGKVMSIEKENIEFLHSKVDDTKGKLIDLNKKKMLLVYDKLDK